MNNFSIVSLPVIAAKRTIEFNAAVHNHDLTRGATPNITKWFVYDFLECRIFLKLLSDHTLTRGVTPSTTDYFAGFYMLKYFFEVENMFSVNCQVPYFGGNVLYFLRCRFKSSADCVTSQCLCVIMRLIAFFVFAFFSNFSSLEC